MPAVIPRGPIVSWWTRSAAPSDTAVSRLADCWKCANEKSICRYGWLRLRMDTELFRRHACATRPCVVPPLAGVHIDPCERNPRRRPQALGVLGGHPCPELQAIG